jgi:UDP-N-acetyl-D-mannosaminuronate dehydrogenase
LKSAVIGLGETGRPLFEILQEHYGDDVVGIDLKDDSKYTEGKFDIINICIPYSDIFVDIVKSYQQHLNPSLTIIHSTVPIGTTSKIRNAVHSPILGRHNRMKEDLKKYVKWIGGDQLSGAYEYLDKAKIQCYSVATSEETEALKLMCLAKYGMSIAFAQYCKDIADEYGFDYEDIKLWDEYYNYGVAPWLKRPILLPPDGRIGGHCIIPNTRILNEQHPNKILEEILKYA